MIWTGVENIPRITIQVSKLKAWWVGGGGGQKAFFEFHFGPKFEAGTKLNNIIFSAPLSVFSPASLAH